MGWKDRAIKDEPKAGGWKSRALSPKDLPPATPPPSKMESFGRGALQSASLNFGDEFIGGVESAFTDKTYEQARDESRAANARAEKTNPKSYFTGEIGGGLATAAIPGLGAVKTLKGAMAAGAGLSALQGAGASESEDLAGVAQDAAWSGAFGGVLGGGAHKLGQVVAPRAKAAYDYVTDKAKKGGVKALSILGGVHDSNINRYIEKPDAVNAARTMDEIGQDVIGKLKSLKEKGIEGSQAATELIPEKGRINVSPIQDKLDEIVGRYKGAGGVDNAAPQKSIDRWRKDFNKIVKNQHVELRDLKTLIKNLDRKIKLSERAGTFDGAEHLDKVALRGEIDKILKEAVPEYKAAMVDVADDFKALKPASEMFGNEKTVATGVERAARNTGTKQGTQRRALDELVKRAGGGNVLEEAENSLTQQSFTKDATHGARRTVLGAAVGGGLEAGRQMLGDENDLDLYKIGVASMGGSAAGGAADRYGPQMTKGVLDSARSGVIKMTADGIRRNLEAAAQRGPQALKVMQFYLLREFPQFKEMLEDNQ